MTSQRKINFTPGFNNKEYLDVDLWNLFRDGDEAAFAQIYDTHISALYQYGSKMSPDIEFVKDCIQDLFINLSNNRTKTGTVENIRFYLIKSLKNRMIRSGKALNKIKYVDFHDYTFALEAILDEYAETESIKQKRRCLRDAINQLPDRQKEIIYLRFINDFSHEEIAQIMEINDQAVRNTLHKAIKKLREKITKEDLILFIHMFRRK